MIIFYNNQLSIEFNESIFNKLNSFKQSPVTSSESGGVLMGKRLLNGNISITNITTPQPKDISSRYFFKKNKKIHQKLSDDIWKSSNCLWQDIST